MNIVKDLKIRALAVSAAKERARLARNKLEDKQGKFEDTLAEARKQEGDLATWSAFLLEKKSELAIQQPALKLEIKRLDAALSEVIENADATAESIQIVWQELQEAVAHYKDVVGNLRQDIKDAKKAIKNIVDDVPMDAEEIAEAMRL